MKKVRDRLVRCTLAIISAGGGLLSAQQAPVVPSNIPGDLPAIPALGTPAARTLTHDESYVVGRQMEAAAEYVRRNPQYAPALTRFRDVWSHQRMRRADLSKLGAKNGKRLKWLTLPDERRVVGSGWWVDVWVPPGGKRPNSDDVLPPNTLLIHDGQIDGPFPLCDPDQHCFFRAHAIWTSIHEGMRQMQAGLVSLESANCDILIGAASIFAADVEIWADFMNNGVPVPDGAPNCTFMNEWKFELWASENASDALEDLAALCDEIEEMGCPVPPFCQ